MQNIKANLVKFVPHLTMIKESSSDPLLVKLLWQAKRMDYSNTSGLIDALSRVPCTDIIHHTIVAFVRLFILLSEYTDSLNI